MTESQRTEWQRLAALEQAGREEDSVWWRSVAAAARETGFAGDLRRAILQGRRELTDLALDAGVDSDDLNDFLAAESELTSEQVARLVAVLGLHLTQLTAG